MSQIAGNRKVVFETWFSISRTCQTDTMSPEVSTKWFRYRTCQIDTMSPVVPTRWFR